MRVPSAVSHSGATQPFGDWIGPSAPDCPVAVTGGLESVEVLDGLLTPSLVVAGGGCLAPGSAVAAWTCGWETVVVVVAAVGV